MQYTTFGAISVAILTLFLNAETSVAPGQSVHLHVAAAAGSQYRVLVYRLGWYRGSGDA